MLLIPDSHGVQESYLVVFVANQAKQMDQL